MRDQSILSVNNKTVTYIDSSKEVSTQVSSRVLSQVSIQSNAFQNKTATDPERERERDTHRSSSCWRNSNLHQYGHFFFRFGSKAIESQQDFEDLPSKIKSEADISKDSNVDCEDEENDDLLPPFWHPADGHGLVFKPGEGKERCFPSYQQAVRWLIQTGDSIKDRYPTEWIEEW